MVSRKELCEGENLACGSLGKVKDGMLKKLVRTF